MDMESKQKKLKLATSNECRPSEVNNKTYLTWFVREQNSKVIKTATSNNTTRKSFCHRTLNNLTINGFSGLLSFCET